MTLLHPSPQVLHSQPRTDNRQSTSDYFSPGTTECPSFPCGTTEFDVRAAWWLSEFSRLAYEPKPRIAHELQEAGFAKVTFFDTGGTQAYLAHYRGGQEFAVLAFRGTDSDYTDLLTDVSFLPRKTADEHFTAHGGFVTALDQVWGTSAGALTRKGFAIQIDWAGQTGLSEALDDLHGDGTGGQRMFLCFTGHSLGGALATLAANRHPPDVLYTFGSPKVAGRRLAAYLEELPRFAAYRVVNSSDVVTHVPLGGRFAHVGRRVYLTRSGSIARLDSPITRAVEALTDLFLVLIGIPVLLVTKLIFEIVLGTLADIIVPGALRRLNKNANPVAGWWRETIKPRLLFMFDNHRITAYSKKLARLLR